MTDTSRLTCACMALLALAACKGPTPDDSVAALPVAKQETVAMAEAMPTTPAPAAPIAAPVQDLTLPGEFSAGTTLQELQQRFGKDNVSVQDIDGAEGQVFHGVMLFPNDPAQRAALYFQDEKALRGLSMINISEATSRWKLESGIGIGTPFAEVRRLNGKPFTFSGFEWDYGGSIIDWQGGKLANPGKATALPYLRLQMAEADLQGKDYPIGDAPFSSDDPRWAGLKMTVGEIRVGFPGEDDL